MRPARDVLEDHLRLAQEGNVDEDLARNYAEDVLILAGPRGIHRGHDGARRLARILQMEIPGASFVYRQTQTEDDIALLEWTGRNDHGAIVRDGADTFVIRDGKIRAQTIHYTVERAP